MRVEVCEIESVWDKHVQAFATQEDVFLHSWAWGEVQIAAGNPILRLLISDERGVCAAMLCIAQKLFLKRRVILVPRGPVCRVSVTAQEVFQACRSSVFFQDFVMRSKAIAIRIEPETTRTTIGARIKDVEPAHTWMIPLLEYSEEELWNNLKQKTRYNIRLAQKHSVRIEQVQDEYTIDRIIDIWSTLVTHTSERHGIERHALSYYRAVFSALKYADMLYVSIAFVHNAPVAMNVCVVWGNTTTYLYGASDHTQRAIMAPSLLQWQMIIDAMRRGSTWYDFYGIAPDNTSQHPLAGVTRFKQGFVGVSRVYAGTFEISLHTMWYAIYQWLRTLRRFIRQ